MITITCSACQKKLAVKEEFAGRKVRCPSCGAVLTAPVSVMAGPNGSPPAPVGQVTIALPAAPPEAPTNPTGEKPDATIDAAPSSRHDPALTDFLAPAQADDELGRLGHYRILKILGHGGMGVVFLAEDTT